MQQENKTSDVFSIQPHNLARLYIAEIKDSVSQRFSLDSEKLTLLLDDAAGVYMSEKEPNTLCCLLTSEQNGHMYLVTARVDMEHGTLSEFMSDPIM